MIEFRLVEHKILCVQIVEIWMNGKFRAALYPKENGIRLITTHLKGDSELYTWEFEL